MLSSSACSDEYSTRHVSPDFFIIQTKRFVAGFERVKRQLHDFVSVLVSLSIGFKSRSND